jgi:hypothetical protein
MNKSIVSTTKGAIPSAVWYPSNFIDFGYASANWSQLFELMAYYQKNPIVNGCFNINTKAIVAANGRIMKVVNKGAKNLATRHLKRYNTQKYKSIQRQWSSQLLHRKNISDDEELVEVVEHPFWLALNSDAHNTDFNGLSRLIVNSIQAFGFSACYKCRNPLGQVVSYQYLPTYNLYPERDGDDGTVLRWFYSNWNNGIEDKVIIELPDILIFRWPSPTDPLASGDSPLMSAINRLRLSGKWYDYQDWVISNRARPDWLFLPKVPDGATISQEQAQRFEKTANDKFRGPGNGRVGVGEIPGTIVPISYQPTDLAPLKFDEALEHAVLWALGIPEAFTKNDGSHTNLEAAIEMWNRNSFCPIVTMTEDVWNKECDTEYDNDGSFIFAYENAIATDDEFELEEEKFELSKWQLGLQYGGLENNDYRVQVLDLEPLSDDELEALKPAPAPPPTPEATEPPQPAEAPDKNADEEKSLDILLLNKSVSKGEIDRSTAINLLVRFNHLDESIARNLVTHNIKKAKKVKTKIPPVKIPSHKPLAEAVKRIIGRQEHHYIGQCDGFKDYLDITVKAPQGTSEISTKAPQGTSEISTKAEGLPKQFTALDDWDEEDQMAYQPYIQVSMEDTANQQQKVLTRVGAEEDNFSVVPKMIKEAVDNASFQFAQSTNETTEKNLNDALDQLRKEITDGVITGDPLPIIKERVKKVFENIGDERADMIARTETSRAVHEGQKIVAKASGIVKGFRLLVSDDSCDICQDAADNNPEIGLDGKFNTDDDYSDTPVPLHPNCVLGNTLVSASDIISAMRTRYSGNIYTITFASGAKCSVTKNHRFTTPDGFISASTLDIGFDVFSGTYSQALNIPNAYHTPTAINEIFDTLKMSSDMMSMSVPVATKDFHGDGVFCQSNIDVVFANGFLKNTLNATIDKHIAQLPLCLGWSDEQFTRLSTFDQMLVGLSLASYSTMCGISQEQAVRMARRCHSDEHRSTSTSRNKANFIEPTIDNSSGYTETLTRLKNAFTSNVSLDKVIGIDCDYFSGHVYDLQTSIGLYICNNSIITGNCRCTMQEIIDPDAL